MKKFILFLLISFFSILVACSGGGGSDDTVTDPAPSVKRIYGKAEKGPLQKGAIIQAAQWTVATEYTGSIFVSSTTDNEGAYTLAGSTLSGLLDISADGFFINENTGTVSDSRIVISGLVDANVQSEGNINIVTHIIKLRVMALMRNGKTFSEANNQAITELYATMNWQAENPLNTSISENGKLLFLSAALCKNKTVDQVSNLLTVLTADMEDGTIDISVLDDSFAAVDCDEVENIITAMYGASPDINDIQTDLLVYRNLSAPVIIRVVDPVPAGEFYYFTDTKSLFYFHDQLLSQITMHVTTSETGQPDVSQNFNCIDFFKIGNVIYFSANYDGTVRYYSQENGVVSEIEALPEKPAIARVEMNNGHFSITSGYYGEIPISDTMNITAGSGTWRNIMVNNYHYCTFSSFLGMFIEVHDDEVIARESGLYFWQESLKSTIKVKDSGRMWK